jgi:hypothetical protein
MIIIYKELYLIFTDKLYLPLSEEYYDAIYIHDNILLIITTIINEINEYEYMSI